MNIPIVGNGNCFVENPLTPVCNGLAETYFQAVQRVGQEPFNRDQQEATDYANQCKAAVAGRGVGVGR